MATLNSSALAWRKRALQLELELRAVMSEGEKKEQSWVRDYSDLFELSQKQLDFTAEVLAQLSQKQREQEQVEQDMKALRKELRRARQEREHSEQRVRELRVKMQEMENEAQEMKRNVEELVRFNLLLRESRTQLP